ncbi:MULTISPECIES: hypothetical protein [Amycolatopsis]|uniref:CopG family transcriptional regulator n=1 Tax=Amycolatopsis rubida TaxID=112413 RepID=A0A1I5ZST8_9PSEU|nr:MULTISPECIES: hypothetical protein [Amycolatopsis]MCG3754577.1 hypothetical protein [Amycolatopsis sp. Poz14]MYW92180.1 hypothetical protein [Amycolatopsis rubida]NEC57167.1 hypothetical protein [Amycolatopsis rubida]OAP24070.1 hypothetical protein A4R44_05225 [Amycolatopsis sp. M39]SFQ59423.1 hypothetical protein SAMN05421854_11674 [Amycolatopsis rubida]
MATRKVTLSLDTGALEYAERAAKAHGISVSSWLSKAARREAVRTGYTPQRAPVAPAASSAEADEAERAAAEKEMRAQG